MGSESGGRRRSWPASIRIGRPYCVRTQIRVLTCVFSVRARDCTRVPLRQRERDGRLVVLSYRMNAIFGIVLRLHVRIMVVDCGAF